MAKNPLNISLKGMSQFDQALKKFGTVFKKEVELEVVDAAKNWEGKAKAAAPTDQGRLKAEITSSKTGTMEAQTTSQAAHSPYLEFGTLSRVKVPAELQAYALQFKGGGAKGDDAKRMIYAWMERVGIPKERQWIVFISIMVNGIRPQPFFFPQKPIVEKEFFSHIQRIINTAH